MQDVFEHANPCFRILFLDSNKRMTNGLFVGRVILENIICMKWESQNEKRHDFCGLEKSRIYFHERKF
jgi:hypothetical protein